MPTLKELAVLYAKKQPKQVENLTFEAPILSMLPFEEASHEMWNVYEEITEITGAGFVNLDAVLPTVGRKSELKKVDLSVMGGEATVPEDRARLYGGAPTYFAKQEPSILRKSGMTTEIAILYNNFRQYAIDNSKTIDAGGSANKNFTIIAVRFVPGETTGLYSPKGFANGAMLDVKALNGGNLMKIDVTRNGVAEKVNGYAIRYKGYFGMQLANVDTVAIIKNVDRDSAVKKIPTADQINTLLDNVRASNNNTFLFMHPRAKSALNTLKNTQLRTFVGDNNYRDAFDRWNDIPIITSYNFTNGTEANI